MKAIIIFLALFCAVGQLSAQLHYDLAPIMVEMVVEENYCKISYRMRKTNFNKTTVYLSFITLSGEQIFPRREGYSGDVGKNIRLKKDKTYTIFWNYHLEGFSAEQVRSMLPIVEANSDKQIKRIAWFQPYLGAATGLTTIRKFEDDTLSQRIRNVPLVELHAGLRLIRLLVAEIVFTQSGPIENFTFDYYSRISAGIGFYFPLRNIKIDFGFKTGLDQFFFFGGEEEIKQDYYVAGFLQYFIHPRLNLYVEGRADGMLYNSALLGFKYYF
ncbi:MAG: hypothetical protein AAF990_14050 [Bacteroidota bacterium]